MDDEVLFLTGYDSKYTHTPSRSPTARRRSPWRLSAERSHSRPAPAITVNSLEIETGHQDAYYDNIRLDAGP